jgi:AcrR family transcriptional regulator
MSALAKATEAQIADAALGLLERQGPAAVSMRRVAAAVGVTPMAIYHYFPSREALLQAVTDREFGKLLGFIEARQRKIKPRDRANNRLIELTAGYIDYALSHPRIFDYVFSEPRPGARQFPSDFRSRRSPTLNLVADCIEAAMEKGEFAKDDVWEIALAVWAHVHGYLVLYRAGRIALSEPKFRSLCRRSVERMIRGLQNQ